MLLVRAAEERKDENALFRSTTITVKIIARYIVVLGSGFLRSAIGDVLSDIVSSSEALVVSFVALLLRRS
jgi:hypothetical protein